MFIHQMGVKMDNLNANIDCEIYVEQPDSFMAKIETSEKLIQNLNRYTVKNCARAAEPISMSTQQMN